MEYMDRNSMLKYLEELNLRLKHINRHCDITIFGGAAMALVFEARDADNRAESTRFFTSEAFLQYQLKKEQESN